MFSHATLGVNGFEGAMAFYAPLMAALGLELKFRDDDVPWAGWKAPGADRPLFIVMAPVDGARAGPGNGQMLAFLAPDRATVTRAHALALSLGGSDAGAPGLRPHYHDSYFGAYFRDPEGNRLCVVCHAPTPHPPE